MIERPDVKRIFFLTDTHIGIRNHSEEWLEYHRQFFYDWFIPKVKELWRPGDCLVHLGDVFDNRDVVGVKAADFGVKLFEDLAEIFSKEGIYIICGNHDAFTKLSNDINSLSIIRNIDGVEVFIHPEDIVLGGKKILLMPWVEEMEEASDIVSKAKGYNYLFCHIDIMGLKYNKSIEIQKGLSPKKFDNFDRVYSGHIHYAQNVGKVRMLGSPFEFTRSDMYNKKNFLLLDLETEEETYYENKISPKRIDVRLDSILDKTPDEVEKLFNNNFVYILFDPRYWDNKMCQNVLGDMFKGAKKIFYSKLKVEKDKATNASIEIGNGGVFTITDLYRGFVKTLPKDEETKAEIEKTLEHYLNLVTHKDV